MRRTMKDLQLAKQRDSAAEIAARRTYRLIQRVVDAERSSRYPVLTAENIREALAWQEARIAELTSEGPPS